ncbi:MAG TPA: muconolactone Delta-isomerase family protein [Streptosporangiaceae bacterium]|jgi:muconolactone D-isomerase
MNGSPGEYLVDIKVRLPGGLPADERQRLLAAELRRGKELRANQAIQRIWRVPGALRNVGIWSATDATELHELISSLPLFPYMEVAVTPLAVHPVESESQ